MPRAPEYTPKQKRQFNKQRRLQARKEGAQQEFPGAPIWNDWLREQHERRKREIGLPRRIGRAALEAAAISVLVAKELPRAFTDERYKSNANKAQRLQRAVDRSSSAEVIPSTDLRKVEKSRLRRLGRSATSAAHNADKRSLDRTSQRAEHLSAKSRASRQSKMGPVEAWASNKLRKIDSKRQAKRSLRQEQFEAEKDVAWAKYLKENPEVEQQLIAEQQQKDKQYEVDLRRERYNQMQGSASSATKRFVERNAKSFSQALPHRPQFEGSYNELAKSSLELATKHRQEDGSINLFSPDMLVGIARERLPFSPATERDGPQVVYSRLGPQGYENVSVNTSQSFRDNNQQLSQEVQNRVDYTGGVATSLWKMGFVEFACEQDIADGYGEFNPDIEWSRGEDGTTFASLAYDPENELHRIIAGEQADSSSARIQLAINDRERHAPEMSVSLVEQPALVYAA